MLIGSGFSVRDWMAVLVLPIKRSWPLSPIFIPINVICVYPKSNMLMVAGGFIPNGSCVPAILKTNSLGSTVGFQFRRLTGNYPGRRSFDASSFIDGYVQEEAKLNVLWLATGSTQVSFLGGWVQRKQHSDVHRVDRGTNARLIVDWAPTSRVKLVGQTWREFAAIEGALIDDALNTGLSARATWDLSEKTQTMLDLKHERRDFSPSTKAGNMLPSGSLTDSNNMVSVGWVYKPLRTLSLKLAVFREQRSGSAAAGTNSYNANGASFDVSTQF